MKRYLFLFVALVIGILTSAQTQQGYVKTKGRMVNGKLVPGQGLKGATRRDISYYRDAVYDYVSRQYGGSGMIIEKIEN